MVYRFQKHGYNRRMVSMTITEQCMHYYVRGNALFAHVAVI